jgi:hypothetical protein
MALLNYEIEEELTPEKLSHILQFRANPDLDYNVNTQATGKNVIFLCFWGIL